MRARVCYCFGGWFFSQKMEIRPPSNLAQQQKKQWVRCLRELFIWFICFKLLLLFISRNKQWCGCYSNPIEEKKTLATYYRLQCASCAHYSQQFWNWVPTNGISSINFSQFLFSLLLLLRSFFFISPKTHAISNKCTHFPC